MSNIKDQAEYDREKRVEAQMENPETGSIITTKQMEKEEAQRVLVAAFYLATKQANKLRRGTVSNIDLQRVNDQLRTQPLEILERRVFAMQVQNPGLLVEAMKLAGYNFTAGADGSINIEPEGDQFGGLGRPLTVEEFEKL